MHGTTRRAMVGAVATLALALTGCSGDDGETSDPAAETTADEAGGESADTDEATGQETDDTTTATVATSTSDLGDIIVDADGRTLYMFVPDDGGDPTCTDDCAEVWPVFEGPATAGDGADTALLSTVAHPSGTTQATYGDWPLYYFANDAAPGDVNGQGVNDVWFVIGPDGEPIRDDVAASGVNTGY